ncbi:MAG: ATP-dependent chaperone ClpB, partial [Achromobacter sp.]|nr:ATP-dependent chaperone ClpB [Achromobacter sp.]
EIEQAALTRETDAASKERLEKLREELAGLKEEQTGLTAQWDREKQAIDGLRSIKEEIERTRIDMEKAEREYDMNKAAELKYGKLNQLEGDLARREAEIEKASGGQRLLREEVGPDDVAQVIARSTGIPVTSLLETEREKLLRLPDELPNRVV